MNFDDFKDFFYKYGFVFAGAMIAASVLLPMAFSLDYDSSPAMIIATWAMRIRIRLDTFAITQAWFIDPSSMTLLEVISIGLSVLVSVFMVIAGGALLIVSAFTTSMYTLTKIFRIAGLSLAALGFTVVVVSAATLAWSLYIMMFAFWTDWITVPIGGFWLGAIGLGMAGVIIKLKSWEETKW